MVIYMKLDIGFFWMDDKVFTSPLTSEWGCQWASSKGCHEYEFDHLYFLGRGARGGGEKLFWGVLGAGPFVGGGLVDVGLVEPKNLTCAATGFLASSERSTRRTRSSERLTVLGFAVAVLPSSGDELGCKKEILFFFCFNFVLLRVCLT